MAGDEYEDTPEEENGSGVAEVGDEVEDEEVGEEEDEEVEGGDKEELCRCEFRGLRQIHNFKKYIYFKA